MLDQPGCGLVQDPAPKVVPTGYALATDFVTTGVACGHCPLQNCRVPGVPGKGALIMKDKPGLAGDRFTWRWANGAATTKADFGDPLTTTDYALCVYDGASTLVTEAHANAAAHCNGNPCWKESTTGFKFREAVGGASPHSLRLTLKEGAAGLAKITVSGKGGINPAIPPLPVTQPVDVQLVNGAGTCWQSTYSAPASRDDSTQFHDKGD